MNNRSARRRPTFLTVRRPDLEAGRTGVTKAQILAVLRAMTKDFPGPGDDESGRDPYDLENRFWHRWERFNFLGLYYSPNLYESVMSKVLNAMERQGLDSVDLDFCRGQNEGWVLEPEGRKWVLPGWSCPCCVSAGTGRKRNRNPKPRKPITAWIVTKGVRTVPEFVINATGLDTVQKIRSKYPNGTVFSVGKLLPRPKGG